MIYFEKKTIIKNMSYLRRRYSLFQLLTAFFVVCLTISTSFKMSRVYFKHRHPTVDLFDKTTDLQFCS